MFLFEIFADIVLHPVHYLLCGAATVIFFLLLLALSEHLPFVASYLIAAFASALLTSIYLASVTGKFKIGASMILLFSVLYAYLYLSLKSEDYAFLIGTLFAFCVLASVMFLTRKVNWSSLHRSEVEAKAKE
jgi:inner membrane protein